MSATDTQESATVVEGSQRRDVTGSLMEDGCIAITHEKKYYNFMQADGGCFVKRSVSRDEWLTNFKGELVNPRMPMERLKNEVAAINYIRRHTNVPVPNVRCAFEDKGCYYIITDLIPGIDLADVPGDQKAVVIRELEGHIATLRGLNSDTMGGFLGAPCLPHQGNPPALAEK